MKIDIYHAIDPVRFKQMSTAEIRQSFLIGHLFKTGEMVLSYSHVDRAVVGSAVPAGKKLKLEASKEEFAADFFAQRREIGVMNIGGGGTVTVDGNAYSMDNRDVLYISRGSREIWFKSDEKKQPARFYIVSYPAHAAYPTTLVKKEDAASVDLGSQEQANKRTIYKYIHPGGVKSCQLVMGFTQLEAGSVWNTMSPHTHIRRSEIYMYFDVAPGDAVFHFMGEPSETRNVVIRDGQAVISPVWSIHAGAGTRNYAFVWSMGGENQDFDDMDFVDVDHLL